METHVLPLHLCPTCSHQTMAPVCGHCQQILTKGGYKHLLTALSNPVCAEDAFRLKDATIKLLNAELMQTWTELQTTKRLADARLVAICNASDALSHYHGETEHIIESHADELPSFMRQAGGIIEEAAEALRPVHDEYIAILERKWASDAAALLEKLQGAVESLSLHHHLVGDYSGAYSLGVSSNAAGFPEISLKINDATRVVPEKVTLFGHEIAVVVDRTFKAPVPL